METSVDKLFQEVSKSFLEKIDQQDLDPRFLEKLLQNLFKKVVGSNVSISKPSSKTKDGSISEEIKKAYKELVKNDQAFIEDVKRFFKKVFNKNVVSSLLPAITQAQLVQQPLPEPVSVTPVTNNAIEVPDSPELKNIQIEGIEDLKNVSIEGIDKLKDIEIPGIEKIQDIKIPDIDDLKNIQIEGIDSIKNIEVTGLEKIQDIGITGLEKLEDIKITGLEELKDIKITGLEELKDISIEGTDQLKDISIKGIDQLKDIETIGVDKIQDISVEGVDKLKDLEIKGIDSLKNVSILGTEKLKDIKVVGIESVQAAVQKNTQSQPLTTPPVQAYDEGRPDILKKEEGPQEVIVVGFASNLMRFFKEGFDGGLKNLFKDFLKEFKSIFQKPSGVGLIGGGLALLLGGLAALVAGLTTDGPFKGLLKILSKVGLSGAVKALEIGGRVFIAQLKLAAELVWDTIKGFGKSISRIFGKDITKTLTDIGGSILKGFTNVFTTLKNSVLNIFTSVKNVFMNAVDSIVTPIKNFGKTIISQVTEFFGKIAGKSVIGSALKSAGNIFKTIGSSLFKILRPILGRIPGIGTIISWGFAYTRFKSGDTIGGIIDILSGIATLFPGIGTAIGIGLDVLNAFLDYKTGGSSAEASVKKGGIIKGWLDNAWNYWKEKILNLPLIKNIIEIGDAFSQGKWGVALTKLTRLFPGVGWIMDWMGLTEDKQIAAIDEEFAMISDFFTWIKESIIDNIVNFVGSVIDWSKEKLANIISYIPGLNKLVETETPEAPQQQRKATVTVNGQKMSLEEFEELQVQQKQKQITPMADGGIVTKPTTALIGEAGPEAVVPLEKYFNVTNNNNVDNKTLESIANNTQKTNQNLKNLTDAIFSLAQVFNNKSSSNNNNVFISGQQQQSYASAAQIAATNVDPIRNIRRRFLPAT